MIKVKCDVGKTKIFLSHIAGSKPCKTWLRSHICWFRFAFASKPKFLCEHTSQSYTKLEKKLTFLYGLPLGLLVQSNHPSMYGPGKWRWKDMIRKRMRRSAWNQKEMPTKTPTITSEIPDCLVCPVYEWFSSSKLPKIDRGRSSLLTFLDEILN